MVPWSSIQGGAVGGIVKAMSNDSKYLFVSYARSDARIVRAIVRKLDDEFRWRSMPVKVWIDEEYLRPGELWDVAIRQALEDSLGILAFVSPRAIRSEWIRRELEAILTRGDRLILPVILERVPVSDLPAALAERQWLDLSRDKSDSAMMIAVKQIVEVTKAYLSFERVTPPISPAAVPKIAAEIAEEARGNREEPDLTPGPPESVFLVHGHDTQPLADIESFLKSRGIKATLLSRVAGPSQSLFQKFLQFSRETRFAIVLLTADDLGSSRHQYEAEGVGDRALQFRARQNVILELGFFYGFLGWERVFVLTVPPDKVFPNFEKPSDLDGVVFDVIDKQGIWRESLAKRLTEAGFGSAPSAKMIE